MTILSLKRLREKHDISQLELGREVPGVGNKRICMAEKGRIDLRDKELEALMEGIRAVLRARARKINESMPGVFAGLSGATA